MTANPPTGCSLSLLRWPSVNAQEFSLCFKPISDLIAWVVTSSKVDFIGPKSHVIFRNGRLPPLSVLSGRNWS